jgi:hypothetical protein
MNCFFQIPLSAFPAVKELAAAYSHRRVRMRCRADFLFQRKGRSLTSDPGRTRGPVPCLSG